MLLLLGFALIAGVGTAFSPCVLPVLPLAMSAGATGGRRRPLGVATGVALSHTFALVLLVYVLAALGLPDDLFRTLAVAVLLVFGLSLLVPAASARVEAFLSRFARRTPEAPSHDGFWSGFALGTGLGFVYAPCAGPILAGVVTVSAAQDFTAGRLAVALAYGIGSAIGLYALMLGGRRLARPLARRSGRLQQVLGGVMVAMAVLLFADVDTRFQTAVASDLPAFLVNPTERIERAVEDEAAGVRGGRVAESGGIDEAEAGERLPVFGAAPELLPGGRWFNSAPLSLRKLRGKVVLVDFWTYTCINCIRTFPHLREWHERYRDDGLVIVGVHTPEFAFEKEAANVRAALEQSDLRYPVMQDNDYATWQAYGNRFWPAKYLIDADGQLRLVHFGEGEYDATERAIRSLLAEAGSRPRGGLSRTRGETITPGVTTPETYLGSARAAGWQTPLADGRRVYPPPGRALPDDAFALEGEWTISRESATAGRGAAIRARFGARRVFLVLDGGGRARSVRVLLDGRPLPNGLAGSDVRDGVAHAREQRLYRLVELPRVGRHDLRLELEPGVSAYAFTFG